MPRPQHHGQKMKIIPKQTLLPFYIRCYESILYSCKDLVVEWLSSLTEAIYCIKYSWLALSILNKNPFFWLSCSDSYQFSFILIYWNHWFLLRSYNLSCIRYGVPFISACGKIQECLWFCDMAKIKFFLMFFIICHFEQEMVLSLFWPDVLIWEMRW